MEAIFQFLSESPIILFFIIAALLSFFRGGAKKEEQQQGQPQRKPATDKRKQEVDWKEIFRQEEQPANNFPQDPQAENRSNESRSTSVSRSEVDADIGNASNELQERYDRIQERKKQAMKKAGGMDGSPIARSENARVSKPKIRLDFSSVSRDEAVKGVVWAEILGKPKGRRRQ